MKITFTYTPVGSNKSIVTVLCAGSEQSPETFRVSGSGEAQTAKYLRGAKVNPIGRGQTATTVSFAVWKIAASLSAAENELMTIADMLGATGNLKVETQNFSGGGGIRYLTGCVCTQAEADHTAGLTTHYSYTFNGGLFGKS